MMRLSAKVNRTLEYNLAISGILMTLIVVLQVFFRYVLNHSLFWSEELARYLLIWLTFTGASVGYYRGAHPGVDFFHSRLSIKWQISSNLLVHLLSMALFGVMIVKGGAFAWFVRMQISPALSLPKWIIMGVVPVSGIILMVHGVAFFLRDIEGLMKSDESNR